MEIFKITNIVDKVRVNNKNKTTNFIMTKNERLSNICRDKEIVFISGNYINNTLKIYKKMRDQSW